MHSHLVHLEAVSYKITRHKKVVNFFKKWQRAIDASIVADLL